MSPSLTTIIKPPKLFYFQVKTEYFQLLVYFENAIKSEKLVFDVFVWMEGESMTFMLLKTIERRMALYKRLLYQEILR